MTYAEAIEALRGNPRWWWYEYYGRADENIQQQAIVAAREWLVDAHLREAATQPETLLVKPCVSC